MYPVYWVVPSCTGQLVPLGRGHRLFTGATKKAPAGNGERLYIKRFLSFRGTRGGLVGTQNDLAVFNLGNQVLGLGVVEIVVRDAVFNLFLDDPP